MDNSLHAHLPILIQVALGIALPVVILTASHLFGQRVRKENRHASRDEPYECGIAPDPADPAAAEPHPRNAVKYCTAAMLFILFDIEAVFLVPWALGYRGLVAENSAVAAPAAVFIALLAFGLFYEHRRGALEWERPAPRNAGNAAPPTPATPEARPK